MPFHDARILGIQHRAGKNSECGGALFDHGGECIGDIVGTGRRHELKLYSQVWAALSISFNMPAIVRSRVCTGMPEDSDAGELRHGLSQQLQSLGDELGPKKGCARHVPARPREAGYQFVFNGIGHAYCNDGNDAGRLFCRAGGRRALRHNDIDLAFDQLNCGLAKSIWI